MSAKSLVNEIKKFTGNLIVYKYLLDWGNRDVTKLSLDDKVVFQQIKEWYSDDLKKLYRAILIQAGYSYPAKNVSLEQYEELLRDFLPENDGRVGNFLSKSQKDYAIDVRGNFAVTELFFDKLPKHIKIISDKLKSMHEKELQAQRIQDVNSKLSDVESKVSMVKSQLALDKVGIMINSYLTGSHNAGLDFGEVFSLINSIESVIRMEEKDDSPDISKRMDKLKAAVDEYSCYIYGTILSCLYSYVDTQIEAIDRKIASYTGGDQVDYINNIYSEFDLTRKKLDDFSRSCINRNYSGMTHLQSRVFEIGKSDDRLYYDKYDLSDFDGITIEKALNELKQKVDDKWKEVINTIESEIPVATSFEQLERLCRLKLYCDRLYHGEIRKESGYLRNGLNFDGSRNIIDDINLNNDVNSLNAIVTLFGNKFGDLESMIGQINGRVFWYGSNQKLRFDFRGMRQIITKFNELGYVISTYGKSRSLLPEDKANLFYNSYQLFVDFCQNHSEYGDDPDFSLLIEEANRYLNNEVLRKLCGASGPRSMGTEDGIRIKVKPTYHGDARDVNVTPDQAGKIADHTSTKRRRRRP